MKRPAASSSVCIRPSMKRKPAASSLCLTDCSCSKLTASVLSGKQLEDVHYSVHKLRDDQNRNCVFSASVEPAVKIDSGDVVEVQTLDARSGYICPERFRNGDVLNTFDGFEEHAKTLGVASGNPMCEPIYVEGAEPGDILKVEVLQLRSSKYGWTRVQKGGRPFLNADDLIPDGRVFLWNLYPDTREDCETTLSGQKVRVPYRPFLGVMGVAPPMEQLEAGKAVGVVSTGPPNINGGNMDNRHLSCEGSVSFYPVHHRGALFSCGDGHAAQGDGEVGCSAIETGMSSKLRLTVVKASSPGWSPPTPCYITPGGLGSPGPHFGTQGIRDSMHEAAQDAVRYMVDWLVAERGLLPAEALALCSVAGDLKISEVVDMPKYVVSMNMPLSVFRDFNREQLREVTG
eukprot:TRINITY_DN30463_c0_g1_i2.p1 TRINITY_DN30463_c0_g1~~TRINITY_DN30463_c0_g1_i2.p1  ORF type:complete len:402 (-),score=48.50 TRINITY_DN30463_c0_g1_i2:79-1284(-)